MYDWNVVINQFPESHGNKRVEWGDYMQKYQKETVVVAKQTEWNRELQ